MISAIFLKYSITTDRHLRPEPDPCKVMAGRNRDLPDWVGLNRKDDSVANPASGGRMRVGRARCNVSLSNGV